MGLILWLGVLTFFFFFGRWDKAKAVIGKEQSLMTVFSHFCGLYSVLFTCSQIWLHVVLFSSYSIIVTDWPRLTGCSGDCVRDTGNALACHSCCQPYLSFLPSLIDRSHLPPRYSLYAISSFRTSTMLYSMLLHQSCIPNARSIFVELIELFKT